MTIKRITREQYMTTSSDGKPLVDAKLKRGWRITMTYGRYPEKYVREYHMDSSDAQAVRLMQRDLVADGTVAMKRFLRLVSAERITYTD